jgi:hypothetical protein
MKEWCTKNDIKLSCPPSWYVIAKFTLLLFSRIITSQEAIVKGAALRGLELLTPTVRLARRHYGYSISKLFREGVDNENDAYFCDWDNRKMCGARMQWFVAKVCPKYQH